MEKARPVSLKEIRIRDNFWDKYRRLVREEILKYQWCAMNDQIEGAPKSHCIENFRIAAGEKQGGQDSAPSSEKRSGSIYIGRETG